MKEKVQQNHTIVLLIMSKSNYYNILFIQNPLVQIKLIRKYYIWRQEGLHLVKQIMPRISPTDSYVSLKLISSEQTSRSTQTANSNVNQDILSYILSKHHKSLESTIRQFLANTICLFGVIFFFTIAVLIGTLTFIVYLLLRRCH